MFLLRSVFYDNISGAFQLSVVPLSALKEP